MDTHRTHDCSTTQFDAVAKLLAVMVSGEEEWTAEDRHAIESSREYLGHNPEWGVPFEQLVADLGFSMDEVRGRETE